MALALRWQWECCSSCARTAKAIAEQHPDFHKCSSPGAAQAKNAILQLNIVSADGKTLKILKGALDTFNENIRSGGDRVYVKLAGSDLTLHSVLVLENGHDMSAPLRNIEFILVTEAEVISGEDALAAP